MFECIMFLLFDKIYCNKCKKYQKYDEFRYQTLPPDIIYYCAVCGPLGQLRAHEMFPVVDDRNI